MAKAEKEPDFEQAFQQLEDTVERLDKGGLTLSQATDLYERGVRLARLCGERLDSAELKVRELQNAFQRSVPPTEAADA